MDLKAFAVTCERHYPGIVSYYAAETEDGAINAALYSMRKIGGRARRSDINSMRAPEYDHLAALMTNRGCIDAKIKAAQPG